MKTFLAQLPFIYPFVWRIRERHLQARWDAFILSYPKCGRTWLRAMIGKALAHHFDVTEDQIGGIEFGDRLPLEGLPRIRVAHEGNPHLVHPMLQQRGRNEFRSFPVVLLVRDPRDVIVSNYFQATRRDHYFSGTMSEFLRSGRYGMDTYLKYLRIWETKRHVPRTLVLIRYEDLIAEPSEQLKQVLAFIGCGDVDSDTIKRAVEECRFEKMHKQESAGESDSGRLKPGDLHDPESYKIRRGIVGGYREYLTEDDVAYIEARMARHLPAWYGYEPCKRSTRQR